MIHKLIVRVSKNCCQIVIIMIDRPRPTHVILIKVITFSELPIIQCICIKCITHGNIVSQKQIVIVTLKKCAVIYHIVKFINSCIEFAKSTMIIEWIVKNWRENRKSIHLIMHEDSMIYT